MSNLNPHFSGFGKGIPSPHLIFLDGKPFIPKTAFCSEVKPAFGYYGEGPKKLAYEILYHFTGSEETALKYYIEFLSQVVVHLPPTLKGWQLDGSLVRHWVEHAEKGEFLDARDWSLPGCEAELIKSWEEND